MNVLVVHAVPLDYCGGAEISLRYHVEHAPADITVTVAHPEAALDLDAYDGLVLANLRPLECADEAAQVCWANRWIDLLHSYRGFALRSERDIHPCGLRDGQCVDGALLRYIGCNCSHQTRDVYARLYAVCSAVQFLSPAHQHLILQLIPVDVPQHVIASPIDARHFRSTVAWEKRAQAALIIGDDMRVAPTAAARARQHGFAPERLPARSIPYEAMPELYNRYQAVVIDPVMFQAFGRTAVEAQRCGCRVIASRRVGALSWPDPIQAAAEANKRFWHVVRNGIAQRRRDSASLCRAAS